MLQLTIVLTEDYDEEKNLFSRETKTIELEHSLVSLSKWESIWEKPFISREKKTQDETLSYILCMALNENSGDFLLHLTPDDVSKIEDYVESKQTATTITEDKNAVSLDILTAEVIYSWMVAFNIPFECQNWHLNKLLTLIKVCSAKNGKPKKMTQKEILERNRALNEQRKAQLGTRG